MSNSFAVRTVKKFWKKEITRIATLMFLVLILAGTLYLNFEKDIKSLFEAIYFSVVTLGTVGYGDITPKTASGRIVTIFLIFSGMVLTSLFTATISSIIISKKIRDGQGVNKIKEKNLVVICGWNWKVESIIRSLIYSNNKEIVLVNDSEPGQINAILEKYPSANIKFVKGDFTDINILNRANVEHSKGVIIVPDNSIASSQGADEKTVFATMTIKAISEKIKVFVQLIRNETIPYIERAKADDYFISDNIVPFFLTSNIASPGISDVILKLMSFNQENILETAQIPKEFAGKTFRELSKYYREKDDSILIALVQFQDILEMKNIDSKDNSSIDAFI
ncbi:MAG: NAD-binding protein, partial [Candidatus Delongbacteria bacterium]|nr:NAD-binding protein [Candidatus Delongbacteria bacterium]